MINETDYPVSPQTSNHLIWRSVQIAFWILFRPSVWRSKIQQVNPKLSPNFCFSEFSFKEIRTPLSLRLFITPLLVWPVLVFLFSLFIGALNHWLFQENYLGHLFNNALLGALAAFSTSLLMSLSISYSGGLIYGIAAGLSFGLLPGAPPAIYFALGFSAGLAGDVMRTHLQMYHPIRINLRNLAAMLLWLGLIGVLLFIGSSITHKFFYGGELNVNAQKQIGLSPEVLLSIIGIVGISYFLIMLTRVRGLAKAAAFSIAITIYTMLCTMGMHQNAQSNEFFLFLFSGLNRGVLLTLTFGLAFSIVAITGWQRPAIVFGAIFSGTLWVPIALFTFKGFIFDLNFWLFSAGCVFIGLTFHVWRPWWMFIFQTLANLFLFVWDRSHLPEKTSLIHLHPAFWDEMNYIAWTHLDQHLILLAQHDLPKARQAMLRLAFGRQRQAVFQAYLELVAEDMEQVQRVQDFTPLIPLDELPIELPFAPLIKKFVKIANDVQIAENQTTVFNTRTALAIVREQVVDVERLLRFTHEPHAVRFLPAAAHWHVLLTDRLDELAHAAEDAKEIDNPYIYGVPIKENRGVFVGRIKIFNQIEQLLLAPMRPPLFLFGQRRMGKTSLLSNLTRTLPSTIPPMFVDCQGLSGSQSYADLLFRMVNQMRRSASKHHSMEIPPLNLENLPLNSPFLAFDLWLDQVENILQQNNQIALMIFDEFVALDDIFWDNGLIPDEFLRFLRHIIQHRDYFRVLISGSHSMAETEKWSSYLVNTRMIKLSYLEEEEARMLIETPISRFALIYQPEAVTSILELTRMHPYLIQLLCSELVEYKNTQPLTRRYLATPEDVETCVPPALQSGEPYFANIKEPLPTDALNMLALLAQKGRYSWISADDWRAAYPNNYDLNLQKLLERDLVEPTIENSYRFQIELVRRWIELSAQKNTLIR